MKLHTMEQFVLLRRRNYLFFPAAAAINAYLTERVAFGRICVRATPVAQRFLGIRRESLLDLPEQTMSRL